MRRIKEILIRRKGDNIGRYKVIEIKEKSARLADGAETIDLKL